MDRSPILLVEDNRQDELLFIRALRKAGIANQIDVVRDGQQALDYLFREGEFGQRREGAPAIVLLDIGLPRLSGIEVLERMRAHPITATQPTVMLTSSDDVRDRHACYRLGCNSFVRKPLGPREFSETIGKLGVYWLTVNAPPPIRRL